MDHKSSTTVYDLVHQAGGPTFVASQLRISSSTVHAWMREGRIPSAQRRLQLMQLAQKVKEFLK
ncbi:hypothetical protein BAE29_07570 [Acidithiobacillus caldus]|uniref:Helix-turn-helix domain-containing protein n=1 Tax=Acidithiobacillus caldus TaxID=33059 RepID=A0A1E7YKZ0_9PROT|nr:hypothetical protein BAE28_13360 [Acidithiobacillus caldus]OFC32307.1 hypothetical protein BAE27_10825 [Acidithiobacillus caldus]OFC39438.1 hypothetical protein BAE29_07570 [Acidithiobacillus caldus]